MIHALIKTTRTTAFALRRHTHNSRDIGRGDWCENYVHTIPVHNDTIIRKKYTHTYITVDDDDDDDKRRSLEVRSKKAAYKKKEIERMQARIKLVSNSCMYVSVCDRSCFTTVKKRTTTGVQQRKKEKKRTTSKIGNTKRTKNMSTSLEKERDRERKSFCIA